MKVSAVEVHRVEDGGTVKAVVNVILSGEYAVGPFRIVEGVHGLYVNYPKRQGGDGKWYPTFRPLSRAARDQLNDRILAAYGDSPGDPFQITRSDETCPS